MKIRGAIAAAVIFTIAFGSQAMRIPAEVTATRVQASLVQAAVGQAEPQCIVNRGLHCTSDPATYKSWMKNQPSLDNYRKSDSGSRGISDYERQHMTVGNAGSPKSPPRTVKLKETTTVHDTETGQDFKLDTTTPGYNWKDIAEDLARSAPSMVDNFQQRQAAYDHVQQIYQKFYEQAAAQNAALADEIRSRAEATAAQAAADDRAILPNFAAALASLPSATLSSDDLLALKRAREIAESPLSNRIYEMNQAAYAKLAQKMHDALSRKDYGTFFDGMDPYTRGKVDGANAAPSSFNGVINPAGVVNVNRLTHGLVSAPFDKRPWSTPFGSGEGEIVRRLANKFQQAYIDTAGLQVLTKNQIAQMRIGELALALGDHDLAKGLIERGSSFLALANQMLDAVIGSQVGIAEGAVDLVKSIPELGRMIKDGAVLWTTQPKETWAAVVDMMQALPEMRGVLKAAAAAKFEEMMMMSDYDRGRAIGHLVFDVGTVFVSFGETAAVEGLSTVGKLEALAGEASSAAARASAEGALDAMAVAAKPLGESVRLMSPVARDGLVAMEKINPSLATAIAGAAEEARAGGKVATAGYLEKMMSSKYAYSADEIEGVAASHEKLMEGLKTAPTTEFTGTVSRGAKDEIIKNAAGVRRPIVEKDLYDTGSFNASKDHRFSIGGEAGEAAQYWAVGPASETVGTVRLEIEASNSTHIIMTTTQITASKLLDTTNPNVVAMLTDAGFPPLKDAPYAYTQALGNAARANGYEGIIFESAKVEGATNVVLFK